MSTVHTREDSHVSDPPSLSYFVKTLPRKREQARIRKALLLRGKSSQSYPCVLSGPPGSGKSTLAHSLSQDEQLLEAFSQNVFLLDVGVKPTDLLDQIHDIGENLDDSWDYPRTVQKAFQQLFKRFEKTSALFIFDDVDTIQDAIPLIPPVNHISCLLVTRNARISWAINASEIIISPLTEPEVKTIAVIHGLSDLPEYPLPFLQHPLFLHLISLAKKKEIDVTGLLPGQELDVASIPSWDTALEQATLALLHTLINQKDPKFQTLIHGLSIFPVRTPLSYPVISAFWHSLYDGDLPVEAEEQLIADLTELCLLEHRIHSNMASVSDLLSGMVKAFTDIDISALHEHFLSLYPIDAILHRSHRIDDYLYRFLSYHLDAAHKTDTLLQLLLDVNWIVTKLEHTDATALQEDYGFIEADKTVRMVEEAIRLSSSILDIDKGQLANQLIGRLKVLDIPSIDLLVESLRTYRSHESAWLEPFRVDLTTPSSALLKTMVGHQGPIQGLDVDRTESRVITGSSDNTLKLWDARSGACLQTLVGHADAITQATFSPDGECVISASDDLDLNVWSSRDGELLRSHRIHSTRILALEVLPDNRSLLSSDESGNVVVSDLWTGEIQHFLSPGPQQVWAFAVTPEQVLAFIAGNDAHIEAWELETGRFRRTLKAHDDWIWSLVSTQNGRYLISASEDRTIIIWDLYDARVLRVLKGHRSGVRYLALTNDDAVLISADEDQSIIAWDIESGHILRSFTGLTNWMYDLAVLGDGRGIFLASDEPELKLWSLGGANYQSQNKSHAKGVRALVFSPDELYLISASDDTSLKKWYVPSGTVGMTFDGHSDWISDLKITSNGRKMISASFDKTLIVWEFESGERLHTLKGHTDWVLCTALSWNNTFLVSGSEDRTIKVWDLQEGRIQRTITGHESGVTQILISDDNRYIISSSLDRTIRVWRTEDGVPVQVLRGHKARIGRILMSSIDQRVISASEDGTIRTWNFSSGYEGDQFVDEGGAVRHIRLVDSGLKLASTSEDGGLRIWDAVSCSLMFALYGHTKEISHLAVSGDGKWAATTGYDHALCLWDIEKGQLTDTYYADYPMTCCAFSRDGNRLIGADAGGGLHFLLVRSMGF